MSKVKEQRIQILLIILSLLLVGCGNQGKEAQREGKEEGIYNYEEIEDITPRQVHMGEVLNKISGGSEPAIVSENQPGYSEKLEEMGLDGTNLREFALYSDEDKVYVVIDTELGMEAKVFEDVGQYIIERSQERQEIEMGEDYQNERLYVTSIGDYMVVVEDDNPEEVSIEMINGLLDIEYPIKSSEQIQADQEEDELHRAEQEKLDKENEAEQQERERLKQEEEGEED